MPAITKNLLSISKFTRDNCAIAEFNSVGCVIKDQRTKRVMLQGSLKNGLYELKLVEATPQSLNLVNSVLHVTCNVPTNSVHRNKVVNFVNNASNHLLSSKTGAVKFNTLIASKANSVIWHAKLGHPAPFVLQKVLHSMHFPFRIQSFDFCDSCRIGKMHRLPFERAKITAAAPLEIISSDVWGPAPMVSSEGYRYYITFIDSFTRFTWIFPMKLKSEAFSVS